MEVHILDALQYSTDREGPWALYIFNDHGFHSGKRWFGKTVMFPDEEITLAEARELTLQAIQAYREVRITDGGDNLVFHAVEGEVKYGNKFFDEISS